MTTEATADKQPSQPVAVLSSEGLGPRCRSATGDVMLCADAACGWLGRCVVAEPMAAGEGVVPCADCRMPNSCTDDGACLEAYIGMRLRQERDCRTCTRYTLHHRADVPHCSSPIRCVDASRYERADYVQMWEAAPVDAGF